MTRSTSSLLEGGQYGSRRGTSKAYEKTTPLKGSADETDDDESVDLYHRPPRAFLENCDFVKIWCTRHAAHWDLKSHALLLGSVTLTLLFIVLLVAEWNWFAQNRDFQFSVDMPVATISHFAPPVYFSAVSLNLATLSYKDHLEHQDALQNFAERFQPDFLAVEGIERYSLEVLDRALHATHNRVQYSKKPESPLESSHVGWQLESTIYVNRQMWEVRQTGLTAFGSGKAEDNARGVRNLYYMRCGIITDSTAEEGLKNLTILVAVASLTPGGSDISDVDLFSSMNDRVDQAGRILEVLERIRSDPAEPLLLFGDMGDGHTAQRIFAPAGLRDPFSTLNLPLRRTYPAMASATNSGLGTGAVTRDWIFSNDRLRPVAASVPYFTYNFVPPSMHWPVQAIYELLPCNKGCRSHRSSSNPAGS